MGLPSTGPPVSVSVLLEHALYDAELGFYETGGRAGRRGDFLTSPEVGPLFGVLVGRALDGWWDGLGRPDPFVVHEHGAGPGTLARGVVQSSPRCAAALRWVLVERSASQRRLHPDHLPHVGDLVDTAPPPTWDAVGGGPWVASAPSRPSVPAHVVLANELLDNLPFDLAEQTSDGWRDVRVRVAADGPDVVEALAPLDPARAAALDRWAPGAAPGTRVPIQTAAAEWLADVRAHVRPGGRVVVLDYGSRTATLASRPWRTWVRTYRGQQRGGHPFAAIGTQDVTVEVALDQLVASNGSPVADRSQAEWLRERGLDALVAEARTADVDLAGPDALAAMRLRSRLPEAEALTDPAGLGGFRVWEWLPAT